MFCKGSPTLAHPLDSESLTVIYRALSQTSTMEEALLSCAISAVCRTNASRSGSVCVSSDRLGDGISAGLGALLLLHSLWPLPLLCHSLPGWPAAAAVDDKEEDEHYDGSYNGNNHCGHHRHGRPWILKSYMHEKHVMSFPVGYISSSWLLSKTHSGCSKSRMHSAICCCIISYRIMWYHITLHHSIPHRNISHRTTLYRITWHHVRS